MKRWLIFFLLLLIRQPVLSKDLDFKTSLSFFERDHCPFVNVIRRNTGDKDLYFRQASMVLKMPTGKHAPLTFTVDGPEETIDQLQKVSPGNQYVETVDLAVYFVLKEPGYYSARVLGIYVDPISGVGIRKPDRRIKFWYAGNCKRAVVR